MSSNVQYLPKYELLARIFWNEKCKTGNAEGVQPSYAFLFPRNLF